ncbi:dynein axonemal light chain 1-like isoform X3 [Vespula pensylvanica]|uniref:dynein axonemal light chain 1-like isoform X3 n=1 Tax=Vespula pensylvanica TaxID=30213 RepID=UPI001CBA4D62|nr:dynein axonemal light chain 1-like isoform X3 [Vespula pensylvanica]
MAVVKATTCKEAIRRWEEENKQDPATAKEVVLSFQWLPIEKMDNSLACLTGCEKLSLSTNMIEKITGIEELWISYNYIEKMKGISAMRNLRALYMSNNLVRDWLEFSRLQELTNIRDLSFVGNPLYDSLEIDQWRLEVARRLPHLEKLDGEPIIRTEDNTCINQTMLIKNDGSSSNSKIPEEMP